MGKKMTPRHTESELEERKGGLSQEQPAREAFGPSAPKHVVEPTNYLDDASDRLQRQRLQGKTGPRLKTSPVEKGQTRVHLLVNPLVNLQVKPPVNLPV